jgi:hypothetical protein
LILRSTLLRQAETSDPKVPVILLYLAKNNRLHFKTKMTVYAHWASNARMMFSIEKGFRSSSQQSTFSVGFGFSTLNDKIFKK